MRELKTRLTRVVPRNSPESFAICREIARRNGKGKSRSFNPRDKYPLEAHEIREILINKDNLTSYSLGTRYGVSRNTIVRIRNKTHKYYMEMVNIFI